MLRYVTTVLVIQAVSCQQITTDDTNVGPPLNADDFALAAVLPKPNITHEEMHQLVAEGEQTAYVNKPTRNIMAPIRKRWPNAEVPYTIDAAFTADERSVIAAGIADIQTTTCIRFVARTTEVDYVKIQTGDSGCYAYVGYFSGQNQYHIVNLQQNGCVYKKIVLHELLHILGVNHEQCRPDRDDFLIMHWNNLKGTASNNFWLDQWDTTPDADLPTSVCSSSGLTGTQTRDFSNCWSGDRVTAHGYPFDFTSVMMYGLKSFAVDSANNVMTPKDASITTVGGDDLSVLDIKKLSAGYSCSAAEVNSCGGYVKGDSGTITTGGQSSCDWLIEVEPGYAIKLSTTSFQAVCPSKLEIRNGNTKSSALINSFCDADVPTMIISPDASMYISWSMVGAGQSFTATWEKVAVTCCDSVKMASTGVSGDQLASYMITYTHTAGDDVNGRPIYRNGVRWLASTGTQWIVSSTTFGVSPGSGSGLMFGSGTNMCPTGVGEWRFNNQVSGGIMADTSLTSTCAVQCPSTIPTAPTGAVTTWNSETTVNTVVSYKCSDWQTLYASCSTTGAWTPATIPACGGPEPPPTEPTTAPPTAPTTAPPTLCPSARRRRISRVNLNTCRVIQSHGSWDGVTKYSGRSGTYWHIKHPGCDIEVTCEGFSTRSNADCSGGDRLKIIRGTDVQTYCNEDGPDGEVFTARVRTTFRFIANRRLHATGFRCNISCVTGA